MSYQVLARKWRPQRFDDVVGQGGVTRTLQNAIGSGRIAQAFVFAGPRGVGKTTTARILARALNCQAGPTAQPCGTCDACVEIAAGRDMDVLEIDAATHTQVDKVREVIISGLSIPPVRDRYKIFIIDEVHQLSGHSFNALLKSIEEPPPHVVFMMATTELQKIPETITSRSQVHEFRTISERAIVAQLQKIAAAEKLDVAPDAMALVARAADGSMRDALTAFDQVLAFAGETVTALDVSTVLGLVGRDLLLDIVTAVADEQAPAAFELAGRAIENGFDLRLLCRELSRLVRDLMLVSVDQKRLDDVEVVPAGERERIAALVKRFSREDLLRSFDLVARAEADLRAAAEPRYHLEMALLKWIHLRKLAPLADLIEQLQQGGGLPGGGGRSSASGGGARTAGPQAPVRRIAPAPSPAPAAAPPRPAVVPPAAQPPAAQAPRPAPAARPAAKRPEPPPIDTFDEESDEESSVPDEPAAAAGADVKDAFLAEVKRTKVGFFRMTVAQAHRIEVEGDRLVFSFSPAHRLLKDQLEQNRTWLEPLAARVAGRRMHVVGVMTEAPSPQASGDRSSGRAGAAGAPPGPSEALKAEVAADPDMKTLLELIPLEIKDIEKI
ncbi:MAG TPA: DNA polymerase III subunit gamma/tau [Vicinamibacterales bacterium]|jgi:DNA polymerase-3 subunit gamma/tau